MAFLIKKPTRLAQSIGILALCLSSPKGLSQDAIPASQTLDQLLNQIKIDAELDTLQNKKRETEFFTAKGSKQELLSAEKKKLAVEKSREAALKKQFDSNEKNLVKLESDLKYTMGTLGELFGVVRQVAGDTKGQFETSIVSAQFPGRQDFIDKLSSSKELPSATDLKKLWIEITQEIVESGKIALFESSVTNVDGSKSNRKIHRIGSFNLISDGKYLIYNSEINQLAELARQPSGQYLALAEDFAEEKSSLMPLAIDPSRGAILSALIRAPSLLERYHQGGLVGYVISLVFLVGLIIGVYKFVVISGIDKKVSSQLASKKILKDNPLGLIFDTYQKFAKSSTENLELALEEAIIKSTKGIEKGIKSIKILAAIAPLLGLLGTVTGMIGTFQSMMLFGSGDPKVMAGGISQALVTTVLGLVAAIPLILLHSIISDKSKTVTEVIEEQSVGLMAKRVEGN